MHWFRKVLRGPHGWCGRANLLFLSGATSLASYQGSACNMSNLNTLEHSSSQSVASLQSSNTSAFSLGCPRLLNDPPDQGTVGKLAILPFWKPPKYFYHFQTFDTHSFFSSYSSKSLFVSFVFSGPKQLIFLLTIPLPERRLGWARKTFLDLCGSSVRLVV